MGPEGVGPRILGRRRNKHDSRPRTTCCRATLTPLERPMRIETHILQNFAPSNLNRDDTGSPKDAEFGGHRRARLSTQCSKRAARAFFNHHNLIPDEYRAERTKRLAKAVTDRLVGKGREPAVADRAARAAVSAFLAKSESKEEHKTPYLLFLGQ